MNIQITIAIKYTGLTSAEPPKKNENIKDQKKKE